MASRMLCTERYDAHAATWFLHHATLEDLHLPDSPDVCCITYDSDFARKQGLGTPATFDAEAALGVLKVQATMWLKHGAKVHYRYGAGYEASEGGRLIASTGYQNWPRFLRALLGGPSLYWDVDIVNAQPVLLLQLAKEHGWAVPALSTYVANREETLTFLQTEMGATRSACKQKVIAVLFGCTEANVPEPLHTLWEEVKVVQDAVWELPEYAGYKGGVEASQARRREALGKRANKDYDNRKGALLAIVLQTEERKALLCIKNYLSATHGLHMHTLVHDGGLVSRTAPGPINPAILWGAEAHVKATMSGLTLSLAEKEWGPVVAVPEVLPAKAVRTVGKQKVVAVAAGKKRPVGRPKKTYVENPDASEAEEGEEGDAKGPIKGVSWKAYNAMKAQFEASHFYYVPTNTYVEVSAKGLRYYEIKHAKEYFDIAWAFGGETNFTRRVSFLDLWRMDPDRRSIHRIDFTPTDDPNVFYMPVELEYVKSAATVETTLEEEGDLLDIFKTLVKAASGEEEALAEYLMNYFAHMLQKPLEQPGVAIILTGAKGVGKDTLLDFLRLHVIGPAFSHNYTETRQFFDKHDVDRKDKFFIKVEDSDSALCKQHAKDLRARITAREGTINPKGRDPITYNNYARYFFTANQAVPVGINDDNDRERRFAILAVSSFLKGNTEFWVRCYTRLFTDKGGKVVGQYLAGRDLSAFQVRALPKNEYQENLYEVERTPEQRFIEDGWKMGEEWSSATAFRNYQTFCNDNGFPKWTETALGFGQKLAYFVMQRKLAKRIGRSRVAFYKKIKGADAGEGEEGEEGEGAAGGAGAYTTGEGDLLSTAGAYSSGAGAGSGAGSGFSTTTTARQY